jgi:hypothetical protein
MKSNKDTKYILNYNNIQYSLYDKRANVFILYKAQKEMQYFLQVSNEFSLYTSLLISLAGEEYDSK